MNFKDSYEIHRNKVRASGQQASPFRIGISVGESGVLLPSPYAPGSRGDKSYCDGVNRGREKRAAAQPVSAGLTDAESFEKFWADKYGEILAPTGDEDADAACRIAKCAASDAWGTALLSAAQRDSQPVASADARDAARYRWLRDKASSSEVEGFWWMADVDEMQRSIDAAIAASKEA
jgi:hypothetical protein